MASILARKFESNSVAIATTSDAKLTRINSPLQLHKVQQQSASQSPVETDNGQIMDELIIKVDLGKASRSSPDGPPQLGITVEDPNANSQTRREGKSASRLSKEQRQQQAAKEYYNHDYQNFDLPNDDLATSSNNSNSSKQANNVRQKNIEPGQRGLKITNIQKGSVIDQNGQFKLGDILIEVNGVTLQRRNFNEAQRTLKGFVTNHSSHEPLIIKALRKSQISSSSLPSTTNSLVTVIDAQAFNDKSSDREPTSPHIRQNDTGRSPKQHQPRPKDTQNTQDFIENRRAGIKHRITLSKGQDGSFGIKIAERDNMVGMNRPIYITAITTTGSAFRDGRLKEGDMLLEVNRISLIGKSQPEVAKMLKSVAIDEPVEFLISRPLNSQAEAKFTRSVTSRTDQDVRSSQYHERKITRDQTNSNNLSLIDLDEKSNEFTHQQQHFEKKIDNILNLSTKIDGVGTHIYDIPLNDTKSAGLGLYLKYPTLNDKDLGIWIEKVITGGAAWKDGRLQPDDQILAINGISLVGLSNAQASETLTAAVCRGIGPEATSNTIRLNICRRDPAIVAKILDGTNKHIEHSDLATSKHIKSFSTSDTSNPKLINETQDSYRTAFDQTVHSRSQSSSETTNTNSNATSTNKLSSNQNSQNDSVMSPQTQASNSMKLSNDSCNEKSPGHNSSDKTNDTSSAISQITDYTSVPFENIDKDGILERDLNLNDEDRNTQPKTLESSISSPIGSQQNVGQDAGTNSWDDESICNVTGEEAFQRDGFGRQSISEKRHAQLMAKNSDTFKRNQKLREERELERQKQLNEQFERQRLDDEKQQQNHRYDHHRDLQNDRYLFNDKVDCNQSHRNPLTNESTSRTNKFGSVQTKSAKSNRSFNHQIVMDELYDFNHLDGLQGCREVPVDVHIEPKSEISDIQQHHHHRASSSLKQTPKHYHQNRDSEISNTASSQQNGISRFTHHKSTLNDRSSKYRDGSMIRSNSLESIDRHLPHENLIIPRSGTVRVSRNRKINESFRAAVDKSYDQSADYGASGPNYIEQSEPLLHQPAAPTIRLQDSGIKSTNCPTNSNEQSMNKHSNNNIRSAVNDKNNNSSSNISGHKKSSSLISRFLKLGSMKRSKKKNKEKESASLESNSLKDSETSRSQTSKGSISKTPASNFMQQNLNNQTAPYQYQQQHHQQQHHQQQYQQQTSRNNHNSQYYGHINTSDNLKVQQHNELMEMHNHHHQQQQQAHKVSREQMHQIYPQYQPALQQHPTLHNSLAVSKLVYQHPSAAMVRQANIMSPSIHYAQLPAVMQQQQHRSQVLPPLPAQGHQMSAPVQNSSLQVQAGLSGGVGHRMHSLDHHLTVQNGSACNQQSLGSWQAPLPPVSNTNGLWVANSPARDQLNQQQQPTGLYQHSQPIYDAHPMRVGPAETLHNMGPLPAPPQPQAVHLTQQQAPRPMVYPANGQIYHHHQQSQMPMMPSMVQHHHQLHNQQPQHIYYYDY